MDDPAMPARRAELLEDLVSQVGIVLDELGIAADLTTHVGHALADHLADHWGGQTLSFPKDHHYRLSLRETHILAESDRGATGAQLARKYRMTERGVRKLLKRAKLRQADTRQADLFGKSPN